MSTCVCNWPKPNKEALAAFYGKFQLGADGRPTDQWENTFLTQITTPFPLRLSWDTDITVRRLTCHREVASSLHRILGEIWNAFDNDLDKVRSARADLYAGCYNFRVKRGGGSLSMHAFGAAIDFDPDRNGFLSHRPKQLTNRNCGMADEVIKAFKDEGCEWGGDWNSPFDPMHFQWTNGA